MKLPLGIARKLTQKSSETSFPRALTSLEIEDHPGNHLGYKKEACHGDLSEILQSAIQELFKKNKKSRRFLERNKRRGYIEIRRFSDAIANDEWLAFWGGMYIAKFLHFLENVLDKWEFPLTSGLLFSLKSEKRPQEMIRLSPAYVLLFSVLRLVLKEGSDGAITFENIQKWPDEVIAQHKDTLRDHFNIIELDVWKSIDYEFFREEAKIKAYYERLFPDTSDAVFKAYAANYLPRLKTSLPVPSDAQMKHSAPEVPECTKEQETRAVNDEGSAAATTLETLSSGVFSIG